MVIQKKKTKKHYQHKTYNPKII